MPKPRIRRSGGEVKALILDAARELFSERGYAGATTREIAARAGTSEVLLFRHFTTKAQLFEQAVFEPVEQYIKEFHASHFESADPGSIPETKEFVAGLHDLLSRNRHLLMALVTAESYESGIRQGLGTSPALMAYFRNAEGYMQPNQSRYLVDLRLSVRLAFATALGAVLFQDWLFADVPKKLVGREYIDQLTLYLVGGLEGSHGTTAPKASGTEKPVAAAKRTTGKALKSPKPVRTTSRSRTTK
ncbi:MAG: helix-turn-helix domain-containing protein [Pseudoxanthomonas sp.]